MKVNFMLMKILFLILILFSISGCGDDKLPLGGQLEIFPSVYDLSDPAKPMAIDISYQPFDDQGNPFTGGNALIWINESALGYLALEGEVSGQMMALSFSGSDTSVNCWYVPTQEEETVTVYASVDQYPHTNVQVKTIRIINQVLSAEYVYTVNGLIASFFNNSVSSSAGGALTYLWDFGDATTSTLIHPQHTYAAAGTYPVVLTVTEGGNTDTKQLDVTVE